jgi:hypothetical protein
VVRVYIFDTNVFITLGHYYPSRFPTIWNKIDELATNGSLRSVKEVFKELQNQCHFEHVFKWAKDNKRIFTAPGDDELKIVADIFKQEKYRGLVKKANILKGLPVADPFIIASAKVNGALVVTQEAFKHDGARIPTICADISVDCINLEKFLEYEGLQY